jgi:hypothetical protein
MGFDFERYICIFFCLQNNNSKQVERSVVEILHFWAKPLDILEMVTFDDNDMEIWGKSNLNNWIVMSYSGGLPVDLEPLI